jgi:hypothetical protein
VAGIERTVILKDIRIPRESVDSYATKPRLHPCPIRERRSNLDQIGRLVVDAIDPYVARADRARTTARVLAQLLLFTYPFWLFEYRRVQSWRYAAGFCLGMRPRHSFRGLRLDPWRRLLLHALFGLVSTAGLTAPTALFDALYPCLHRLAKARKP